MAGGNHAERAHALLSASGANRWMNCTPSALIEDKIASKGDSPFAREGTLAHEFGELELLKFFKMVTSAQYKMQITALRRDPSYTDEMEDQVEKYTDYVRESFAVAKKADKEALLFIEEKFSLDNWIKEGFGTNDSGVIGNGLLEVIDLKYGKGVRVDAEENSQLKLYALGALESYEFMYDLETVKLTIVQPRLDHISTWEISVKDLKKWGDTQVKPKAEKAFKGEGLQKVGDWCRFCKAKAQCATMASNNLKVARHEFKDPHLLTDPQLLEVYRQVDMINDWAGAVKAHMLAEALTGKAWPGLKVVEGTSHRKWKDTDEATQVLKKLKHKPEDYTEVKFLPIGKIEKLVGKKNFPGILGHCVTKPQGKPSLVPASDKRQAYIKDAKDDFNDDLF